MWIDCREDDREEGGGGGGRRTMEWQLMCQWAVDELGYKGGDDIVRDGDDDDGDGDDCDLDDIVVGMFAAATIASASVVLPAPCSPTITTRASYLSKCY